MRTVRNVAFLILVGAFTLTSTSGLQGYDCDWNGVCEGEEWAAYYMCGDCGPAYCSNYCSTHDEVWMEQQCSYSGWELESGYCDSMGSTQNCDISYTCVPPI